MQISKSQIVCAHFLLCEAVLMYAHSLCPGEMRQMILIMQRAHDKLIVTIHFIPINSIPCFTQCLKSFLLLIRVADISL